MNLGDFLRWVKGSPSPVIYNTDKLNLGDQSRWDRGAPSPIQINQTNTIKTITSSAIIKAIEQKTILSDAKIKATDVQKDINSDTKVIDQYQETINSDAHIKILDIQKTILSDTIIKALDVQKTILSDALISLTKTASINSDAKIKAEDVQKTVLLDAKIVDRFQKDILSDSHIKVEDIQKNILSDTKIKALDVQKTILSDSIIKVIEQKNILSDAYIFGDNILKTILSDAKIIVEVLYNINNKFNSVIRVLANINNKFNFVIRVLSDINNFINTAKGFIYNIHNDFRTKKLIKYNINNDVRFIKSWQVPGSAGVQSLGKSYIKVYISSAEQTDVDVDSISISKGLNQAHTASFDLGRAYDATTPTLESSIEIKYNDWTLFKGYITTISPAADPESITINCQDEYWKQNQTKEYFRVGHKPIDNRELFYSYISDALITVFGWNPGIGVFIPQTIDCFGIGKSDAISNLIENSGNYGWFYDVDGSKRLWTAGEGSIITIQRQIIGQNLGLYQLIDHKFTKDVSGLVNKFRVQMGEKVIRKFSSTGDTRGYTAYNYSNYNTHAVPNWNYDYEILAKNSSTGYGWDYHKPEDDYKYKNIFKKYRLPYLDPQIESWSDRYPTKVTLNCSGWQVINAPTAKDSGGNIVLTDGFSIDFANRTLTLNDAIFLVSTDYNGEVTSIRAPSVFIQMFKEVKYTRTISEGSDPETEISNPLMFFTSVMGTYPTTIMNDLDLSGLSIQIGYTYTNPDTGEIEVIPSWDDTDYAQDYVNWQLSKNCDIKIRGNIDLTLDTICYYNIDLSKRIFINGITETSMNIIGMNYNIGNFTVTLELENNRGFRRKISLPYHGGV